MIRYVLGFAFTLSGAVALIEKKRPDWQRGRWNGIGGHVNEGETPVHAMSREFQEETGVLILPSEWRLVGQMGTASDLHENWCCYVFTVTDDRVYQARTRTDERVQLIRVDEHLRYFPVIENIPALLALCQMRKDHTGHIPQFNLDYT